MPRAFPLVEQKGTSISGEEFDSSFKRGQPSTFAPNQVQILYRALENGTVEAPAPPPPVRAIFEAGCLHRKEDGSPEQSVIGIPVEIFPET